MVAKGILQELDNAATEAREELECKHTALSSKSSHADPKILALESQIRDLRSDIASQFNDLQQIPYRLHSVFIHRGFHNSGHYWIYIYDFAKQLWRRYNDGYVIEIKDTKEIFEQEPGDRPATPYFLVYVMDKEKDDLADPVCRNVVKSPSEEQQDTLMEDYGQAPEVQINGNTHNPVNSSMGYTTAESYNSQHWAYGDGFVDNGTWNQNEAQASTHW